MIGQVLLISLEQSQLEVELPQNVFCLSFKTYEPLLTKDWIKHLCKFTDKFRVDIISNNTNTPPLIRGGNNLLTYVFTDLGFHWEELLQLNSCTKISRTLTLLDILKGGG